MERKGAFGYGNKNGKPSASEVMRRMLLIDPGVTDKELLERVREELGVNPSAKLAGSVRRGMKEGSKKRIKKGSWRKYKKPAPVIFGQQLVSLGQFAEMMGVKPQTLKDMRRRGMIPKPIAFGLRERWRFFEIEAWIGIGCPECKIWETMKGRFGFHDSDRVLERIEASIGLGGGESLQAGEAGDGASGEQDVGERGV